MLQVCYNKDQIKESGYLERWPPKRWKSLDLLRTKKSGPLGITTGSGKKCAQDKQCSVHSQVGGLLGFIHESAKANGGICPSISERVL